MGVTKEQLSQIIQGKAKALCSPEAEGLLNEKANKVRQGGLNDPDPSMYNADAAQFDSMYSYAASESYSPRTAMEPQYGNNSFTNSRMPENIKKSMMNERIDVSALNPNRSVLDSLGIPQQPRQQRVNEQVQAPQAQYAPQQYPSQQIDYALIKTIIKECLNEYMAQEGGNYLTTIGLRKGNITLVDNKDNVYQAKLEKIGNKNKEE